MNTAAETVHKSYSTSSSTPIPTCILAFCFPPPNAANLLFVSSLFNYPKHTSVLSSPRFYPPRLLYHPLQKPPSNSPPPKPPVTNFPTHASSALSLSSANNSAFALGLPLARGKLYDDPPPGTISSDANGVWKKAVWRCAYTNPFFISRYRYCCGSNAFERFGVL